MNVTLVPLEQATAEARRHHRVIITAVQEEGLLHGRRHNAHVVALLLAAALDRWEGGLDHWTRPEVNRFLKCDVPNWCSLSRVLMPGGVAEALWDLLQVLQDTGRLSPTSDALAHLREPLICYAGLGLDGNDGGGAPCPIPCACYWPVGEERPDPNWDPALGRRVF